MNKATQSEIKEQQKPNKATPWTIGERVALGFSIFFGLIMVSATMDIILSGALTTFLASSIPAIASVVSLPLFPLLVSLISAIAICICLLSITASQHKEMENLVKQMENQIPKQKTAQIIDKDQNNEISGKNGPKIGINLNNEFDDSVNHNK